MTIEKYGQGSSELMSGMQDAAKGEEKILSGLWVNRCNNCTLNYVTVLTKGNNGYALKLDEGKSSEPTIINKIILDVDYKDELILDDLLTNVLVKKIIKQ
jgi:ketopantoate reductase